MNNWKVEMNKAGGFIDLSSATANALSTVSQCCRSSRRGASGDHSASCLVDQEPYAVEICGYPISRLQRFGSRCTLGSAKIGHLLMENESDVMQLRPYGSEIQNACRSISC